MAYKGGRLLEGIDMDGNPLEELANSVCRVEGEAPPTPRGGIAKCRYTHDAMIDLIIMNPAISQNALAAHFGYSPSWISQIISSDAFQAKLAERSKELVDPLVRTSIEEQFKGIVNRSLEILREKLDRPSSAVPDNLTLRALEISGRALGYGARDTQPTVHPGDTHIHLEVLGERLVTLLRQKRAEALPPIDGEYADAQGT